MTILRARAETSFALCRLGKYGNDTFVIVEECFQSMYESRAGYIIKGRTWIEHSDSHAVRTIGREGEIV